MTFDIDLLIAHAQHRMSVSISLSAGQHARAIRKMCREYDEAPPKCPKCAVPMTTGLMAAICPRRENCEFWPEDEDSQEFLDSFGWRVVVPQLREIREMLT